MWYSSKPKTHNSGVIMSMSNHQKYISRITKTLYYGTFPKTGHLSLPLIEFAAEVYSDTQRGKSLDRLHLNEAARISRNSGISPCSLVLALLYLEKLKGLHSDCLEKITPSSLFLVSLMVSCKYIYDVDEMEVPVLLDEWAPSADITVKQLIGLEKTFLHEINWELYVNDATFWSKLNEIEVSLAKRQGNIRGFYTYTELEKLLQFVDVYKLTQCLISVTLVLAATYTVCFMTLIGSVAIVNKLPGVCIQYISNMGTIPVDNNNNLIQIPVSKTNQKSTSIHLENITSICERNKFMCEMDDFKNTNNTFSTPQNITWDWWTIPIMTWLAKSTQFAEYAIYTTFECNKRQDSEQINCVHTNRITFIENFYKITRKFNVIQDLIGNEWYKKWRESKYDQIFHLAYAF